MRGLRIVRLTVIVFAMSVGFATAQSLAELAKKEKERRASNASETKRVVTERELIQGYSESPSGLGPASTQTQEGAGAEDSTSDTEESEEQQDAAQTEEDWQNRVRGVQDKIARLEQQMSSEDWGDGQRVGIDPRGQNSLASREKTSQEVAAARAEIEAIRVEARKAGVPPGWVR